MNRFGLAAVVLFSCAGCITPRSMGMGITPALLGPGGASASASGGVMIETLSASGASSLSVSFPSFEGNVGVGLIEMADLNVHLSSAGLQPGVKIGLLRGPVTVSVLPQVALLIVSTNSRSGSTGSGGLSVGFLGGLKLLGSHESGFYGGFGYDFQFGSLGSSISTGSSGSASTVVAHNLTLNVGFELVIGHLRLRPELAIAITPSVSSSSSVPGGSTSSGPVFAFLPSLSAAVVSPSK